MEKQDLFYEGKTKRVFKTDDPDLLIVSFKDDITAFCGEKRAVIPGKGAANNRMSNRIFRLLGEKGIPTDFVEELSSTDTAVKRADRFNIEVRVRNYAAGGFSERLHIAEGTRLNNPTVEFTLKNDSLKDPFINGYYALALGIATEEDIDRIVKYAFKVNTILIDFFNGIGIDLIDMKLEFGKCKGDIILIDEISPDTCRLWDKGTHEKMDKDRFRRDLGNLEDAYQEVSKRLGIR